MNNQATLIARSLKTLFVGFLFWSFGGVAGWRTLQMQGMPYPQFQAFQKAAGKTTMPKREWRKLSPAQRSVRSEQAKFELNARLGDVVKDPALITKSDVAAVKAAWGKDASNMLSILEDSSR